LQIRLADEILDRTSLPLSYQGRYDDVATVPPEILKLRDERGTIVPTDCMPRSYLNSYGTKLLTFPSSHKFF